MKRFHSILIILLFVFLQTNAQTKLSDTAYVNSKTVDKKLRSADFNIELKSGDNYLFRFKNVDDPSFKEIDFNDSSWKKQIASFDVEEIKKQDVGKGIAWFRLRLKADTSMTGEVLVLNFTGTGAMEVYLDGIQKRKIGNFKHEKKSEYFELDKQPVYITLEDTLTHILALRYEYNDAVKNDNIWGIGLKIATAANFYNKQKNTSAIASIFLIGLGTIFITLSLVHLLMFLFYRKEISNLYFSLFTLSIGGLLYLAYKIFISETPFENGKFSIIFLACSIILCSTSLSAFIAALFSRKKIFLKIILVVGLITLIIGLIDLNEENELTSYLIGTSLLLSFGYAIVMIVIAMFRRMPGALILGSGIIFFFAFWLAVIGYAFLEGSTSFNFTIGYLAILSFVSIPLSISAFLAWRFASTNKNLSKQLVAVETLSTEKQSILENQNTELEKQVAIRTQEVTEQKQRSDNLLLNILPEEVAEELKLKGESKAQRYDEVSVLFTDFVNFTKISEQLGVEELLNELNINFTAFDKIMEKYGLEKIKTIGDAYLAVCGLPVNDERHAQNTVKAALDILEFVQKRKQEVLYGLDIRIGINSGSLIAGIIGVKKFAYDIWGDTVNTAARMEQNSQPGKINISENTFGLVKEDFTCIHRGKLVAKGKGEMDMYFVEEFNK